MYSHVIFEANKVFLFSSFLFLPLSLFFFFPPLFSPQLDRSRRSLLSFKRTSFDTNKDGWVYDITFSMLLQSVYNIYIYILGNVKNITAEGNRIIRGDNRFLFIERTIIISTCEASKLGNVISVKRFTRKGKEMLVNRIAISRARTVSE